MSTLQKELDDLLIVARAMNKVLDLKMTDESLNWPRLEDDDEEDYYDSDRQICGTCNGMGCRYCHNTGIVY